MFYFNKFNKFDEVTRFRLINAFVLAAGMNLLYPVLTILKGQYLAAWIVSVFMIVETLSTKTNRYFVENFTLDTIYKLSCFAHVNFTVIALLYFYDQLTMLYFEMIVSIIDCTIFSAFSIMLNNYLTKNYPENMSEFQIIRNSVWADGIILGLSLVSCITLFFGNDIAIICFLIFNTIFSLWLIKNWNFYKNKGN